MDKKPTYGRCFWSLIVACLLAAPVASLAQAPGYPPPRVLSEVEAVRLGLARPEVEALLEGEIDVARSDVLVAKRLPNPALPYSREDSREVVKRWSERMQAVADIMRRQEAAGEVSAYDGFLPVRHFRLAFLLSRPNQFSRRERSSIVRSDSPISLSVPLLLV